MENIKECIKAYYEKVDEICKIKDKQMKVPYNPRVASEMFIGSEDDEGYITWSLTERQEPVDSKVLSDNIGIQVHSSLIEFIDSYFFMEMEGVYNEYDIEFDCITPNTVLSSFLSRRHITLVINEEQLDLIQIGIINSDGNDNLLMCLVNSTGQIVSYDYDKKTIQVISESLVELIINLDPRC